MLDLATYQLPRVLFGSLCIQIIRNDCNYQIYCLLRAYVYFQLVSISMDSYFRVNFKAQLIKFVLAFKADCQIDIFWKKGEKIAQSSKVPFNAIAYFNEELSISCNMVYDVQTKTFKEKSTKFEIILYTEKGNKKVGEIRFDVSAYLNERLKTPKEYEVPLEKCPDKNARLVFKLTADVEERISADAISHSSERTVNIETLLGGSSKSQINADPMGGKSRSQIQLQPSTIVPANSNLVPTKDIASPRKDVRTEKRANTQSSIEVLVARGEGQSSSLDKNKDLQAENRKMREKLKGRQKLLKENEQLKRKIKNEEYQSVKELKQKIEMGRKQIQKLQASLKRQILLEKQVKAIEDQIFKCKYQIMNAFNYANETGGGKLMFEMQQACGLKQI